jgi:prepilin-type N-terminal cleavage/methylation domain-containing protein
MVKRNERGMTLVELMIASTLFAVIALSIVSAGADFTDTLSEQMAVEDVYTRSNIVRARLLGDFRAAGATTCIGAGDLGFTLSGVPSVDVEYFLVGSDLVRWTSSPVKETPVASEVSSIECSNLGIDSVFVTITLGTAEQPYRIHFRASKGGV